jgi:hypothetical protein
VADGRPKLVMVPFCCEQDIKKSSPKIQENWFGILSEVLYYLLFYFSSIMIYSQVFVSAR